MTIDAGADEKVYSVVKLATIVDALATEGSFLRMRSKECAYPKIQFLHLQRGFHSIRLSNVVATPISFHMILILPTKRGSGCTSQPTGCTASPCSAARITVEQCILRRGIISSRRRSPRLISKNRAIAEFGHSLRCRMHASMLASTNLLLKCSSAFSCLYTAILWDLRLRRESFMSPTQRRPKHRSIRTSSVPRCCSANQKTDFCSTLLGSMARRISGMRSHIRPCSDCATA